MKQDLAKTEHKLMVLAQAINSINEGGETLMNIGLKDYGVDAAELSARLTVAYELGMSLLIKRKEASASK